jgi:hypothetical protein
MNNTDTYPAVGHLIDVQGSVLIASLEEDEQGQPPTVTFGDEDVVVGQIGSYLSIVHGEIRIVAIVTRMSEQESLATPSIDTPGEQSARLPFAKRTVYLTPLGSVRPDGQFERGVGQYPTTGAKLYAFSSTDIAKMFDRYQSKGFSVGNLVTQKSLRVYPDPTNLFGRHFAILGQTGSGKSWTVASLIQKTVAVMPKAHIILLDLHGEYCWKHEAGTKRYAFEEDSVRHVDARDLEIPYWLMTYAELCDLL